ncbi:MutT/nudix family protein [Streptococcus pneumoniae]|nr:MutT/nudix family protein [Streptococcus pneumoniae]
MIALTDTGLTFTKEPFDRERYEDLRSLLSEMLNQVSDLDADEVAELLKPTSAYATPLMDVRAWIVEDEKICLVRGQGEDSWALPGGFGEVGYSPTENILKEIEEETGFKAKVERLLAVFDTNRFQLQSKQYAKFVFECKLLDGQFQENQEIADLQFFAIDQLPNLSENALPRSKSRFFGRFIKVRGSNILTKKMIIVFLNSFFLSSMV